MGSCIMCQMEHLPDQVFSAIFSEKRLAENHLAARFGDHNGDGTMIVLTLEGEDILRHAFECWAGDDGWVLVWDTNEEGDRYVCNCREAAVCIVKFGKVHVSIVRSSL